MFAAEVAFLISSSFVTRMLKSIEELVKSPECVCEIVSGIIEYDDFNVDYWGYKF